MAAVVQLKNTSKVIASPSISEAETVPIAVVFSLSANEGDEVNSGALSLVFLIRMVISVLTVSIPSVNVNVIRYVFLVS